MRRVLPLVLTMSSLAVAAATWAREAPQPGGYAGSWVMKLGERTFIVLSLEQSGESFGGTLTRPEHSQTADGIRYSKISPGRVTEVVVSATVSGDHLRIVTERAGEAPSDRSEYEMTLTGRDEASVRIPSVPIEPWSFIRAPEGETPVVASDWDPGSTYSPEMDLPSDPEMERLYRADQELRQDPQSLSEADWELIGQQDAERRRRTLGLLAEGRLHTSDDFIRAAFIFQHGTGPDDYLLAHTLAMVAAGKGDESASWIGAASLDRYLQSIGRPQIYGTQFKGGPGEGMTQEPFDPDVIPDALRRVLGVPSLDRQKEQQRWFEERQSAEREQD